MESRTKHYFQKYLVRKLTGKSFYLKLKFFKLFFYSRIGKKYEISEVLGSVLKIDDVIFDVGANLGQYISRILRKNGNNIKYFAFEPVNSNYSLLKKYFSHYSTLVLENYAVSDSTGEDVLYIPLLDSIEIDTQASLNYENRKKYYNNFIKQEVKKISVDDYVSQNSVHKIDYLKIDTEGNDEMVITGALKSIEKFRPVLFCEDVENIFYESNLLSRKYSAYLLTKEDKLVSNKIITENTLNDLIIFIPDEKTNIFSKFIMKS